MNFSQVAKAVKKLGFAIGKHSPEILTGLGIVSFGVTIAYTVKGSCRWGNFIRVEFLEDHDYALEHYKKWKNIDMEGRTDEELEEQYGEPPFTRHDLIHMHTEAIKDAARVTFKAYWPAMLWGAGTIGFFLSAQRILKARYAAAVTAYTMLDIAFREYRGRVEDRFGSDVEREIMFGVKEDKVDTGEVDENGNPIVDTQKSIAQGIKSPYVRIFDEFSPQWSKDPQINLAFLYQTELWANQRLINRGHVFLNEVFDQLGLPRSQAGQIVGWKLPDDFEGPRGDNYINFGIERDESNYGFINGFNNAVWLEFNVDGIIWDRI